MRHNRPQETNVFIIYQLQSLSVSLSDIITAYVPSTVVIFYEPCRVTKLDVVYQPFGCNAVGLRG